MTRSELIARLVQRQPHLPAEDVVTATRRLLDQLSDTLARGERIEVRGFGSFSLRHRRPRFGHNPKTRARLALPGKYLPHFKPGIELCKRVNSYSSDSDPERAFTGHVTALPARTGRP
jgi:integration host factor subunit beta